VGHDGLFGLGKTEICAADPTAMLISFGRGADLDLPI
jgi:hypothetical protein